MLYVPGNDLRLIVPDNDHRRFCYCCYSITTSPKSNSFSSWTCNEPRASCGVSLASSQTKTHPLCSQVDIIHLFMFYLCIWPLYIGSDLHSSSLGIPTKVCVCIVDVKFQVQTSKQIDCLEILQVQSIYSTMASATWLPLP